jgi:hypothetical protein
MVLHSSATDEGESGVEGRPGVGGTAHELLFLKGLLVLEHTHLLLENLALLQTLALVFHALLFDTLNAGEKTW